MRTALRRVWICLRMSGLVGAGILVAHLWAINVGTAKHVVPKTTPTTSTASAPKPTRDVVIEAKASTEVKAPAEVKVPVEAHAPVEMDAPTHVVHSLAEHTETSETILQTPLPGSTVATDRNARLAAKGLSFGNPVMIRIFKAESELELWMQKDERFELFATYRICKYSGKLGPKLHEGDKQAPEGMYTVGMPQIHRRGRWPRSLNIGFPNAFDRAMERTGSLILVHGGCSSTGCFAMTNPQMEEIYRLSEEALKQGQKYIPVHVFPFRMTEANLAAHASNEWVPFWRNIKDAYDVFERTRVPPSVSVCGKRYVVREGTPPGTVQATSTGADVLAQADCVDADTEVSRQASLLDDDDDGPAHTVKPRKVVSKTQRRRSAGRNVRQAYAEARKTRMAAHAEKARAKQASAAKAAR